MAREVNEYKRKWCKECKKYVRGERTYQKSGAIGGLFGALFTGGLSVITEGLDHHKAYECPNCGRKL